MLPLLLLLLLPLQKKMSILWQHCRDRTLRLLMLLLLLLLPLLLLLLLPLLLLDAAAAVIG